MGAARPRPVDVRIVCATNRDPLAEVRAGRFREDLYYRLHVVPIHMPPLRGRPTDILDVARASLATFAAEEGKGFTSFDAETERLLRNHPWPGNVRQLLNVIRNVVVLHDGPFVTADMLPSEMLALVQEEEAAPRRVEPLRGPWQAAAPKEASSESRVAALVGLSLAEVEREFIEATIGHCGGSIPRAAKVLGLSPSTVYRKLESWNSVEKSA